MRRRILGVSLVVALVACDAIVQLDHFRLCEGGECDSSVPPDSGDAQAQPDADDGGALCPPIGPATCDPNKAFGPPQPLLDQAGFNQRSGFVSPDRCEFYFAQRPAAAPCGDYCNCGGCAYGYEIYVAHRAANGGFENATRVPGVNSSESSYYADAGPEASTALGDFFPTLYPDGLSLFVLSYRIPNSSFATTFVFTRPALDQPWSTSADPITVPNGGALIYPINGAAYSNFDENNPCCTYRLVERVQQITPKFLSNPVQQYQQLPDGGLYRLQGEQIVSTPDEQHLYYDALDLQGGDHLWHTNAVDAGVWGPPKLVQEVQNNRVFASYITPNNCTLFLTIADKMYTMTRQ